MLALMWLAAAVVLLPLVLILVHLVREGASSINWDFFTKVQSAPGTTGGGMSNAIVGTLVLLLIASGIGLPVGIAAGIYLAENRTARLASAVRFLADVLNGVPSIVTGIFAWQVMVKPVGHFSAWAGGVALATMMIPLAARTTEEMIRTVPNSLREAALALGYPTWRTSLTIVVRTALPGIVTGALVALARVAGETAPLLFTALGNIFFTVDPNKVIAALPLNIYSFAISPYDDWHRLAWAASLVLIVLVLLISIAARYVVRPKFGKAVD
ncbi:MAG: phosphate ABC transporter permease PstA [Gemmatimonadota bacterium]|nr:phosphate ABC transporter permease PstA [Gemmatimonadota bacterium]MDE3127761.1 phosphate ABC transporter permease PstA [Gemmatimonadota bacterium]MDE3215034.1 phosphate ABC transporter permease PstA [Gemmatimonadota bacterium]